MSRLAGKVVLVTRPRQQSDPLVRLLEERGATAIVAPAVQIVPSRSTALDRALEQLTAGGFEWLLLTSRTGVEALSARLSAGEVLARIAVVGDGTAAAVRTWGREPDLVPRTFTTAALGRAMRKGSGRVLLARADIAPSGLEQALRAKGWRVVRVTAYETRLARSFAVEARAALQSGRVDAVMFTSASTVHGFVRSITGPPRTTELGNPKFVCIGPVTAREARALGLSPAAVARPHTIEGLVAALERVFTPKRTRRATGART